MFVNRNYYRTEHDDFVLNVAPLLGDTKEAVPQYIDGVVVGWEIQNKSE